VHAPKELKPAVPRLDGVDVLRGLSILSVILLHIWIRFHFANVRLGATWPPLLSHFVWRNGGNGVTIFFAVSGFLITLTSLRRFGSLRAMRPAVFYRIRFARIMPLLLLLLAVLSALHLLHVDAFVINAKSFTLPRALLAALTFHLNWLETARNAYLPACWTVLWSLSIEEMFYLFFPLACVVLLRWKHGAWPVRARGLEHERSGAGELLSRRHGEHCVGMPDGMGDGCAGTPRRAAWMVAVRGSGGGVGGDPADHDLADVASRDAPAGEERN